MIADSHIHTNNSSDSKCTMAEMCKSAIDKGVSIVSFTDHYDLNPKDSNFRYYDFQRYEREIQEARRNYGDRIEILSGIEFSEPHVYPREFEKILLRDYDFVLGSVHWIGDSWLDEPRFAANYSAKEIYELHYQEVLRMVQFGGMDAVAHMDFPKRYIPNPWEPMPLITDILNVIIEKSISLEVNCSTYRKGFSEPSPSPSILRRYS